MKRFFAIFQATVISVLISIIAVPPAIAIPKIWMRATEASLSTIAGMSAGDQAIVGTAGGTTSFYYYNGAAWVKSGVDVADLITRGPWVDVRSYMDGVSGRPTRATWEADQAGTDVTSVFAAAGAAVGSHGTVLVPPGTYLVTGIIISPSNPYSIKGVGKASKISVSGANYGIIVGADINTVMRGLSIEGLWIVGTSSGKGGIRLGPEVATLQAGMGNMTVKDVEISGFSSTSVSHTVLSNTVAATGGSGIFMSDSSSTKFVNVYSHDNYYGLQEAGGGNNTTATFSNCSFRLNYRGAYLKGSRSFSFTDETVFEANTDSGLYAVTPSDLSDLNTSLSLSHVHFEGNLTSTGSYQAIVGNDNGSGVRHFHANHLVFNGGTAAKHGLKLDGGRESIINNVYAGDVSSTPVTTTNSTSVFVFGGRDDAAANVLDSKTVEVKFDASDGSIYRVNGKTAIGSVGTATTNMRWGTTVAGDNGTIAHGMGTTPTTVLLNGSVEGEIISVSSLDNTNITVRVLLHDGTTGTSQYIYWMALK